MISIITRAVKIILTFFSPNLPKISESPWLSPGAITWLGRYLKADMTVFEYGSGGSTVYLAKRVKWVVSVENSFSWYLAVMKSLKRNEIKNTEIHYIEPEKLTPKTRNFVSSDPKYRNISFRNYVMTIKEFPDRYFDLLFIDGRARNDCLLIGSSKVKYGGYILLDDSERTGYVRGKQGLNKFQKKIFRGTGPYLGKQITVWKVVKNENTNS